MDNHTIKDYLSLGWTAIPVKGQAYGADYEDAKRACFPWQAYQHRKPTEAEVSEWLLSRPKASVAAIMGPGSGVVAVDIDSKDWVVRFPNADFGETAKAMTVRGCHYIYKWEDWLLDFSNNRAALDNIKGLDFRGQGGYIIVPNTNDEKRTWAFSPWDTVIEPMPEWLRTFLKDALTKKNTTVATKSTLEDITEGNRHVTFVSYLGKLQRAGFSPKEMLLFLRESAEKANYLKELQADIKDISSRYPSVVTEEKEIRAVSAVDIHEPAMTELKDRQTKGIEFSTYFPTLDDKLGGLRRGEVVSIGAYTSHGKSLFAGTLAIRLAIQGRVCYFTTEMSAAQYYTLRVAPYVYAISAKTLRHASLKDDEWQKLQNKPDINLWFCDQPSPTLRHVQDICGQINPDIVIIDHLNRCRTDKAENRNQGIADFLIGIKTLALQNNMVAIVTAQLNRASQMGNTPGLFHFRDSGAIEMESDVAILLDKKDDVDIKIEGMIAKNRHGPKCGFDLVMNTEKMIVEELRYGN